MKQRHLCRIAVGLSALLLFGLCGCNRSVRGQASAQVYYGSAEEQRYSSCDLTGDGVVSSADVDKLRGYVAGWPVQINLTLADVNADGKVNAKDATLLRRYVAAKSGSGSVMTGSSGFTPAV